MIMTDVIKIKVATLNRLTRLKKDKKFIEKVKKEAPLYAGMIDLTNTEEEILYCIDVLLLCELTITKNYDTKPFIPEAYLEVDMEDNSLNVRLTNKGEEEIYLLTIDKEGKCSAFVNEENLDIYLDWLKGGRSMNSDAIGWKENTYRLDGENLINESIEGGAIYNFNSNKFYLSYEGKNLIVSPNNQPINFESFY